MFKSLAIEDAQEDAHERVLLRVSFSFSPIVQQFAPILVVLLITVFRFENSLNFVNATVEAVCYVKKTYLEITHLTSPSDC